MPISKKEFMIDESVVYLNHGAFGATPKRVFEKQQYWQERLEQQPTKMISRDLSGLLDQARLALADYLQCKKDDLVYIPSPTYGVNVVAHSLNLGPGDEVLVSNHEYGACLNTWDFYAKKQGFKIVEQAISWPIRSKTQIVENFWQGVNENTRLIFISHISSSTALTMPVEEIIERANAAGIMVFVDGAHAPSQLDLNLDKLGADFYVGACHKWMCAPKGSSFLHVKAEKQRLIEPLVVSWAWGSRQQMDFGSSLLNSNQYPGTRDFSAYLSVESAIEYQKENDWTALRDECIELVDETLDEADKIDGVSRVYPKNNGLYQQMGLLELKQAVDPANIKERLYNDYRIELPVHSWNGHNLLRFSIQAYNSKEDTEKLILALSEVFSSH